MTHKFKNVPMLLFGEMFFLVACQNDAMQEVVDNPIVAGRNSNRKDLRNINSKI